MKHAVILTSKSVYDTLVWGHSKEGHACPLYEFQPFHVTVYQRSITTVVMLAQVILLISIHVAV